MPEAKRIKAELDLNIKCPECEDIVEVKPLGEGKHDAEAIKCDFCNVILTVPGILVREKVIE